MKTSSAAALGSHFGRKEAALESPRPVELESQPFLAAVKELEAETVSDVPEQLRQLKASRFLALVSVP